MADSVLDVIDREIAAAEARLAGLRQARELLGGGVAAPVAKPRPAPVRSAPALDPPPKAKPARESRRGPTGTCPVAGCGKPRKKYTSSGVVAATCGTPSCMSANRSASMLKASRKSKTAEGD